jgi:hypothetical protein
MINSQYIKSDLSKEIESVELFIKSDKLHTIQVSLERFFEKWTKKNLIELEVPQQFEKRRKLTNFAQWINRFALTSAGILTLTGHPKIGGSVSIFYPLIELLISFFKEKIEEKGRNWGEFFKDSENLGNKLDRLLAINESIKSISSGNLNIASKKLNDKIYDFLKEYDKNKDKKIEVSELKINKFARDLKENWRKGKEKNLQEIVQAIKVLQKEVFNYRRHL